MASALARGLRFNYSVLGQGAPHFVGLHGLVLDNLSSLYLTIGPALAAHGSFLLFDLRGHGRTEQPPTGYDITSLALDTDALIDAIGFSDEGVILVGHSFGGLIALQHALLFPLRVKGLILIEAHTGSPEFGHRMAETLTAPEDRQAQMVQELFGNWVSVQEGLGRQADVTTTESRLHRMRSRKRSPAIETAEQLVRNTTLVEDMASTPPITARLHEITCPVLAVYGADSDILAEGEHLANLMPACQTVVIPECGHGVIWQQKPALLEAIAGWLEQFCQ